MTDPVKALSSHPRLSMMSERERREIVLIVLEAVREPSANVAVVGWNYVNADLEAGHQWALNALHRAMIDALIAEVRGK